MKFETMPQPLAKKEEPVNKENKLDDREKSRKNFLATLLENIVVKTRHKINSGNNAIINTVDVDAVRQRYYKDVADLFDNEEVKKEELEAVFAEQFGLEELEPGALKILKVYNEKVGLHEAKMQMRAYDLIERAKQKEPEKQFANVPKVHFYKTIDLSDNPEEIARLKEDGVALNKKIFVIMMDLLQGEDFSEHVYRQSLAKMGGEDEAGLQKVSFGELKNKIEALKVPGKISKNSPSNKLSTLQTYRHNNRVLFEALENNGENFKEDVFDKVNNTIEMFNKQGFYHRDLHERNVFLHKNEEGDVNDVSLIDFSVALETAEKNLVKIYQDANREYVRDGYFVANYKPLLKKP